MEEAPAKAATPRLKRRLRNLSIRKSRDMAEAHEELVPVCANCANAAHVKEVKEAPCGHVLCKACVRALVASAVEEKKCTRLRCPCEECEATLEANFVQDSVAEDEYQRYLDGCFLEFMALEAGEDDIHMVTCPSVEPRCGCPMEWLHPSEEDMRRYHVDRITHKAEDGTLLGRDAWVHFNVNRLRCPQCSADFCASCMTQPYHLGATCEQLQELAVSKQCRFCGCRLTHGVNLAPLCGHEALMACCAEEECLEKREIACHKLHSCGHACGGVRDEEHCLPCLELQCRPPSRPSQQGVSEFCNICWISDLGAEPCIQLGCGHIVHARCGTKVLQSKWNTSYVNFEFWNCPVCKVPMDHPFLVEALAPLQALRERVITMGRQVIEEEALTKDMDLLHNMGSRYYEKLEEFVLDKLTFFQCDRCQEAFYGGRMDCMERNAIESREEDVGKLCPTCEMKGKLVCSDASHALFWVYKCRYCCSKAKFYCFGDTHFCESCHGNVGALRAMVEYPQCSGPKNCPLGMTHAPNGEECTIGCELCLEEFERSPEETIRIREYEAQQEILTAAREKAVRTMSRLSLALFPLLVIVQAGSLDVLLWVAWVAFHVLKFCPAAVALISVMMMFLPWRTFKRVTLATVVILPMVLLLVAMEFFFALPLFSQYHIVSFFKLSDILYRITSYGARIAALILPGCFSLLYLLEQEPTRAMHIAVFGVVLNAVSYVFGFVSGHSSFGDIVDASVAVVRVAYVCFILLGYVSYSMFKCNLGFQHNRWRMLELLASFAVCWAMIMELVIYNVGHVDHVFALEYFDILLRLVLLARFAPWALFTWLFVWPPSSVLTRFRLYLLLLSSFLSIELGCWYFNLRWGALFWNCLTIFRCALYKC